VSQMIRWVPRRAMCRLGVGVVLLVAWLVLYNSFLSWIGRPRDSEAVVLQTLAIAR
jgi:hypothetical protein